MTLTDSLGAFPNSLTFQDSGNLLKVSDPKAKPIYCLVNRDSAFATNISHGSVIDIELGSYFSGLDTELLTAHTLSAMLLYDQSSLPIVATDSGVFDYDLASRRYVYDNLPESDIHLFAAEPSTSTIFAASTAGLLFSRHGGVWKPVSLDGIAPAGSKTGPILALVSDTDQFIALDGITGVFKHSRAGGPWSQLPFMADKQVTALALHHNGNSVSLIIGTSDGQLGVFGLLGNPNVAPSQAAGSNKIWCIASEGGLAFAGTDIGVFTNKGGLTSAWTYVAGTSSYRPVSYIIPRSSGNFLFLSNGLIYIGSLTGASTSLAFKSKALAIAFGSRFFALDDTALWNYTSSYTWLPDTNFARLYYPFIPGGLVMLRNNHLSQSDNWRAGTLVTNDHSSYAITGRVMQRLDSLQINGGQYPDVFVIRYAHELPNGQADTVHVPYWMIYYQRGVGPIMFDKVGVGTAFARRELKTP